MKTLDDVNRNAVDCKIWQAFSFLSLVTEAVEVTAQALSRSCHSHRRSQLVRPTIIPAEVMQC